MSAEDIAKEIRRGAKKEINRGLDIPTGLSEDEAVAFFMKAYGVKTGNELPEADVRAEVRELMGGRATT